MLCVLSPHAATPFFNPSATTDYFKRIVLLLDDCPEETKSVIRSIYRAQQLDEISVGDANELLERSRIRGRDGSGRGGPPPVGGCSSSGGAASAAGSLLRPLSASAAGSSIAHCSSGGTSSGCGLAGSGYADGANASAGEQIRQILIYPPQGKGGISINTEDYMCLAIDQYLNDVIIDFYLQYLLRERLSAEQRARTHVFSTFFYKRLTTLTAVRRGGEQAKMTAAQKRHFRVKNWTKGVNLFDKDFIIIPINEQSHWFLAIICFAALPGPRTMDGDQPVLATAAGSNAKRAPTAASKKRSQAAAAARDSKRVAMQIGSTTITAVSKAAAAAAAAAEMVYVDEEDEQRDEAEGDDSDLAGEDSDTDATTMGNAATTAATTATAATAAISAPASCSTPAAHSERLFHKTVAVKQ